MRESRRRESAYKQENHRLLITARTLSGAISGVCKNDKEETGHLRTPWAVWQTAVLVEISKKGNRNMANGLTSEPYCSVNESIQPGMQYVI